MLEINNKLLPPPLPPKYHFNIGDENVCLISLDISKLSYMAHVKFVLNVKVW